MKLLCIARFTLCKNVRNTPAASWNLSNYYLTLAKIVAVHTNYGIPQIKFALLPIGRLMESNY